MPHKHNADRRHHIPKMAFKVRNWPEYEAGLRRRGSLTLWIEDAALDHWQTFGPGGQARYKDAARDCRKFWGLPTTRAFLGLSLTWGKAWPGF
jgi:hypothetical protein